jgi:hypothetical protein
MSGERFNSLGIRERKSLITEKLFRKFNRDLSYQNDLLYIEDAGNNTEKFQARCLRSCALKEIGAENIKHRLIRALVTIHR